MPMKVVRPKCQHSMTVPDEYAGKKGKCPRCKEVVVLPAAPTSQAPQQAPLEGGGMKWLRTTTLVISLVVIQGVFALIYFHRANVGDPLQERLEREQLENLRAPVTVVVFAVPKEASIVAGLALLLLQVLLATKVCDPLRSAIISLAVIAASLLALSLYLLAFLGPCQAFLHGML